MKNLAISYMAKLWKMGLAHASPIIDPQIKPSNQTLKPDPQKLSLKTGQPLKLDPQKLWQTLKKFDYPYKPVVTS